MFNHVLLAFLQVSCGNHLVTQWFRKVRKHCRENAHNATSRLMDSLGSGMHEPLIGTAINQRVSVFPYPLTQHGGQLQILII